MVVGSILCCRLSFPLDSWPEQTHVSCRAHAEPSWGEDPGSPRWGKLRKEDFPPRGCPSYYIIKGVFWILWPSEKTSIHFLLGKNGWIVHLFLPPLVWSSHTSLWSMSTIHWQNGKIRRSENPENISFPSWESTMFEADHLVQNSSWSTLLSKNLPWHNKYQHWPNNAFRWKH